MLELTLEQVKMFVEKIQGIGANAGCKVCHIIIFYCTFLARLFDKKK
jgi:hypothetical protein